MGGVRSAGDQLQVSNGADGVGKGDRVDLVGRLGVCELDLGTGMGERGAVSSRSSMASETIARIAWDRSAGGMAASGRSSRVDGLGPVVDGEMSGFMARLNLGVSVGRRAA